MISLLFWVAVLLTAFTIYPRASRRWTPDGEPTSLPAEFATLISVIGMMVLLVRFLGLTS